METRASRIRRALIVVWLLAMVTFVYLPIATIVLASLTSSRYFTFPIPRWGLDWWQKTLDSIQIHEILKTGTRLSENVSGAPGGTWRSNRLAANPLDVAPETLLPLVEPVPPIVGDQPN